MKNKILIILIIVLFVALLVFTLLYISVASGLESRGTPLPEGSNWDSVCDELNKNCGQKNFC